MSDSLLTRSGEGWLELTLNRPHVLNALDRATLIALRDAVRGAGSREGCHAVILTGAGERAFSAGADLGEMGALEQDEVGRFLALGQEVPETLEACPLPVIAAVNGFALGGGCEIVLGCDVIIASQSAELGLPEVTLGILPGWGGTQRLPRRVGLGRARAMTLTGRRVAAAEAERIGLVDRVVPPTALLEEARNLARRFTGISRQSLAAAKAALRAAGDLPLAEGCGREAELFAEVFDTDARREALRRFVKR